MNTVRHPRFFLLLLALGLAGGPILRAEDKPAAPVAPAEPAQPEATGAKPAEDKPLHEMVADDSKPEVTADDEKSDKPEPAHSEAPDGHRHSRSHHSGNDNERVSFGSDSTLAAGEQADAVVSIFGSSTSAGEVGDAVVSVIGSSRVTDGTVGDSVVSVLGNTYVDGHVKGEVVSVLGNVDLGPKAVVDGDLVCVGGQITRDPSATVRGNVQNVTIAGHHFNFEGLAVWFHECLLYGRPLAFDHRLVWAWCIALALAALYALIALVVPVGVTKCVETLEEKPGSSILAAILTLVLTPVVGILLTITVFIVIGTVLVPAFSLGMLFASIFGKVVMLAWLGRRFTKLLGDTRLAHPFFGTLIGAIIVLGLYTIPVIGFLVYLLIKVLGLGVVVYTLILQFKASRPPKLANTVIPTVATTSMGATPAMVPSAGPGVAAPLMPATNPSAAPLVVSAATLPRVGFWLRLAASVLDAILVGMICGMVNSVWHRFGSAYLLWYAIYCIVMWTSKGTTIGGIICGLKVVRLDDRPLDWGVSIVRAMGGFLSLIVAGIGFIWVAFDDEKQSWHDKIAGTTIVKVPKGTALL